MANEQPAERPWLDFYIVFEHPADYPDEYVCRIQSTNGECIVMDPVLFARASTRAEIEEALTNCGLHRLEPSPDDPPQIIGAWI